MNDIWKLTFDIWKEQGKTFCLQVVIVFLTFLICVTSAPILLIGYFAVVSTMLSNALIFLFTHPEIKGMKIRYLFNAGFTLKDLKQTFNVQDP